MFRPLPKRPLVAYMPRKGGEQVTQLLNLLRFRGALAGFDLAAIDGADEAAVAGVLGEASVFLSFAEFEGFGLPAAEAMSCGCVVVGYDGIGGRELFASLHCVPVPQGDLLAFAQAAEQVPAIARTEPERLEPVRRGAIAFIREHYSVEREAQGIVRCWNDILGP